ncbi:Phosphoglycerate mutase [Beutenbergia cavernae DSM 12333]|uniref:Phosphoglycerate mutase n=1 Tax=Beutenbergia cavernae (strain ATCC BAA-8 / DSM 12333 / CCUG 43141 / JCM 11478 / NBRC 16432 / NCIMB 13614 / HKI 0122) TaxID=471853 RepID=C5C3Y1_BEUC1|nr:histidine phosphatase family protein [Beutenbergia cavernae]ACQ79894.1 Phosphoglycerate mutase [Beutenbergia cavernae DSM 12333]
MSAGRVILWRHGQTEYNATLRLQGQVDIPLNDSGTAQAARAAAVLVDEKPAAIVASDLVRAAGTAQVLGDLAGLDVTLDERLRERSFGDWEGLTHDQISAGWPEPFAAWEAGLHPEGVNAERKGVVGERFAAAVREAADGVDDGGSLVVVSHGAAIGAGITTLLGLDPEEWAAISGIGNCHWSMLAASRRAPGWRLVAHNIGAL